MNKGFWSAQERKLHASTNISDILFCVHLGDGMDAQMFLHGICGVFALALHRRFGYCMHAYYTVVPAEGAADNDETEQVLCHIFCTHPPYAGNDSFFIDVRGVTTEKESFYTEFDDFFDGAELLDTFLMDAPEEWVLSLLEKDGIAGSVFESYFAAANSLIDEHIEYYSV